MCVKIRKHRETVRPTDVRNPTTAKIRDIVRFDRRFPYRVRNDPQTCDQRPAILFRLKFENPKKKIIFNKHFVKKT